MPDIPEPPMPTKWMRLTLCRMGQLHAEVGASTRRVGFAEGARVAREDGDSISIKATQELRQLFGFRFELLQRDAGLALRKERRVGRLFVGDEPRQREEDRGEAR